MTSNQINNRAQQEEQRHNLAMEANTRRGQNMQAGTSVGGSLISGFTNLVGSLIKKQNDPS